jgi:hypothetical protein
MSETEIKIGDKTYNLVLTVRAVKELAEKFGGIENFSAELKKTENYSKNIENVAFMIALLANQGELIKQLENPDKPANLLTPEAVELLTTPAELGEFKNAISAAIKIGLKRNVESESSQKNVPAAE